MTPKELIQFYKEVDKGGEPQALNGFTGKWEKAKNGPNLKSDINLFRIKPKTD